MSNEHIEEVTRNFRSWPDADLCNVSSYVGYLG